MDPTKPQILVQTVKFVLEHVSSQRERERQLSKIVTLNGILLNKFSAIRKRQGVAEDEPRRRILNALLGKIVFTSKVGSQKIG